MILAQEQMILKGKVQLDEMAALVRQAAKEGRPIDQVERDLWQSMLRLGLTMLEVYVEGVGPGDVGDTLAYEGRELKRLEAMHERRYVSVFGELMLQRYVYGSRETQKHEVIPTDAVLGLPEGEFSALLAEWDQAFCVQGSYQSSRQTVQRILGLGQSVRSLEQMTLTMAEGVEAFRDSQPAPPVAEEGSILVLTADGKGVPMRREGGEESPTVNGHRAKGEKANKKRMACVGAVYSIDPFVRRAEDIIDEVLRDKKSKERPRPQHKHVWAELTREFEDEPPVTAKEGLFCHLTDELTARNLGHDRPVICLMDGERALWDAQAVYFPEAVGVLDLFHVLERLWAVAHCFHKEGSDESKEFVEQRLRDLLQGRVGYVISGLRRRLKAEKLSGVRRKVVASALEYLGNNKEHMRYDEYLARGYPIGSGVAEGACRHLVKDRMEQTGMRWTVEGAQAMLHVRALYLNDQWEEFHEHRVEREQARLYTRPAA
jgi:hypothetical protein